MKAKLITSLTLLFTCSIIYGQINLEHIGDSILKEATKIYRLEKSAWKSTDNLFENYSRRYFKKEIDGYLSYKNEDTVKTIYWGMIENEIVVKNTFNYKDTDLLYEYAHNHNRRLPTDQELKLIMVRGKLLQDIEQNRQIYYKPEGSNYNIILTYSDKGFRAYILIGFRKKNILPLGNDYCIDLDINGKVIKRKRLHKSYLETPFSEFQGNKLESVYHTHLPDSPYITATDICNVMLYSEFIGWSKIEVIAEDYISTYNVKEKTLTFRLFEKNRD